MYQATRSPILFAAVSLIWPAIATASEVVLSRYVATTTPAALQEVIVVDPTALESLCGDEDGCTVILEMLGWNASSLGDVQSKTARLFLSSTSNSWSLADGVGGGTDDNDSAQYLANTDCWFGDFESIETLMVPPFYETVKDNGPGFGLANPKQVGTYSDQYLYCRLVLID